MGTNYDLISQEMVQVLAPYLSKTGMTILKEMQFQKNSLSKNLDAKCIFCNLRIPPADPYGIFIVNNSKPTEQINFHLRCSNEPGILIGKEQMLRFKTICLESILEPLVLSNEQYKLLKSLISKLKRIESQKDKKQKDETKKWESVSTEIFNMIMLVEKCHRIIDEDKIHQALLLKLQKYSQADTSQGHGGLGIAALVQ